MKFKAKESNTSISLLTCDLEQKTRHSLGETEIFLIPKLTNDHRGSHPDVGTVIESSTLEKGTKVITGHFAFEDEMRRSLEIGKDADGEPLFLVDNSQIYFSVDKNDSGKLIPLEGVLLCESIEDKFVDTFLEVSEDLEGKRRDVVKVLTPWEGCEDFKTGDYIYLGFGGDYRFTYEGVEYVRVDCRRRDVLMRLNSPEWRDKNVRKHLKRNVNF